MSNWCPPARTALTEGWQLVAGQGLLRYLHRRGKGKSRMDQKLEAVTWTWRIAYRKTSKAIITSEMFLPGGKTDFVPVESLPDYLRQKDLCWTYWQLEELFPLGHSGKTAKKMFFSMN